MNVNVNLFIESKFKKIKLLKQSDKGEVWLAANESGNVVILKKIFAVGLPYKFIKKNPHAILPKIIYCAESDNETIVVEEFIQGDNLYDHLQRKEYLTQEEIRNIILQLCDGLAKLHSQGIIHRDITPSNLILQGTSIKLIDFDIARIVKDDKSDDTHHLGTKGYAPPEQYGFGQTDARSDIYTLGVTMTTLLGDDYNGYLKKFLSKCTELDPKNRYQSVEQLKNAILDYRPQQKLRNKILSVAASLILILGIYCIYNIFREFQSSNAEGNSDEAEISEKTLEDKIVTKQKNNVTDNVQKRSDNYRFPDIAIPASQLSNSQPPVIQSNSSPLSSKSSNQVNPLPLLPLPKQSTFEMPEVEQSPIEPAIPKPQENIANETVRNYVKVEYYDSGSRLDAWVDNLDYDITNAGTIQYVKSNIWKNWQVGSDGLNIPENYLKLQARVKNYSQSTFNNPQLTITYGNGETKILSGKILQPGEEMTFDIPFNKTKIYNSDLGNSDVKYVIKLHFSGTGAEIRGTTTDYELLFLKIGE